MRTNIVLDDELIKEAFNYSHARTKKELVHQALKEYMENRRKMDLRDLKGKINFQDGYDYKKLRVGG